MDNGQRENLSPTPGPDDLTQGAPTDISPLSQSMRHGSSRFNEEFDASTRRGSSIVDGENPGHNVRRSDSVASQNKGMSPSRSATLKKKNSIKRTGSLKRSGSRRSLAAGSVKSLALGDLEKYDGNDIYSAFFTPVPTKGNPTEILSNRFQEWRRVLKDLIAYFREVQKSHETRSKSLLGLSNLVSNISSPRAFSSADGIGQATQILQQYHKQALTEQNKAKGIEEEIMVQLVGLRSDLSQKIKEIKNLSGDFKNSVDKETEGTRKAVRMLQEALGLVDTDPAATSGRGDPYIVKLGVEKQIERQMDEENYLHKAFLNLEHSGRELESIVVGEIQKAYNAYANILKREADAAYEAADNLRNGPISMPKDREWDAFVSNNDHFVDPRMPIRHPSQITYAGKDAPAATEVRAGMLERKTKYLKSYTPGWYVLSPTHLHEFKSPDRLNTQTPLMSLYLHEQKLGSHSNITSSSHKFMIKGRQTHGMHRAHTWIFRAESRDTMLAWYEDIKHLTEKTGPERDAFVRKHARSVSGNSMTAGSVSSDGGMDEDEADRVPFTDSTPQINTITAQEQAPSRPQPGGKFPSDLNVNRHLHLPLSPSSGSSSGDRDALAAAGALPGSGVPFGESGHQVQEGEFGDTKFEDASLHLDHSGQPPRAMAARLDSYQKLPMALDGLEAEETAYSIPESAPHRSTVIHQANIIPVELSNSPAPQSPNALPFDAAPLAVASKIPPPVPAPTPASGMATPTATMSMLSDSTDGGVITPSRPEVRSQASGQTIQTISDLHVPGQYPRRAKA